MELTISELQPVGARSIDGPIATPENGIRGKRFYDFRDAPIHFPLPAARVVGEPPPILTPKRDCPQPRSPYSTRRQERGTSDPEPPLIYKRLIARLRHFRSAISFGNIRRSQAGREDAEDFNTLFPKTRSSIVAGCRSLGAGWDRPPFLQPSRDRGIP